jgi:hypothetical protein
MDMIVGDEKCIYSFVGISGGMRPLVNLSEDGRLIRAWILKG